MLYDFKSITRLHNRTSKKRTQIASWRYASYACNEI